MRNRMGMLGAALAAMLLCVRAWAAGPEEDTRLFSAMDVFALEYAEDPQISPDGDRILYTRRSMDIMSDRAKGSLWIVDTDGDNHRPVLADAGSYSLARWSPDGRRIVYVSAVEGSPQIYVRWMDSGETAKIADLTKRPGNLAWSPDGSLIAFTMAVDAEEKPFAELPVAPKGAEWAERPRVVTRVRFRADGVGFLPNAYTHVFAVPSYGGTPRQITKGDFNHTGTPAWTPNGEALIVSANRRPDADYYPQESELYEVTLADGTVKQLTDRKGRDAEPAVSPNGRYIAYTGFDDKHKSHHTSQLYLLDRRSGKARPLTEDLDRDVSGPQWAGNDRIYFLYGDGGTMKLGMVTVDGDRSEVTSGVGGEGLGRPYTSGSFSVARDGTYATVVTDGSAPADLASGRGPRGRTRTITDLNGDVLDYRAMGKFEHMTFPSSFDGRKIEAWILTPPGFDPHKKYPLLLEIHGGPHAAYGANFTAEGQLYAAAGYVVLFVNPRGSTGYGDKFANLIDKHYPGEDYDDLMSGVDAVIAKGYIDTDELYVTGGSGGGVLTAWIVGKTDRFRAAVVAKPVINWASFSLYADGASYFTQYWFNKMPWEDPDEYWNRSPLSLVGNVTTPTMLLTGDADLRTPIAETEQFYEALKLRKVDTAMVRMTGAYHGIASHPSQLIAKTAYILAWFDRYRPKKEEAGGTAGE